MKINSLISFDGILWFNMGLRNFNRSVKISNGDRIVATDRPRNHGVASIRKYRVVRLSLKVRLQQRMQENAKIINYPVLKCLMIFSIEEQYELNYLLLARNIESKVSSSRPICVFSPTVILCNCKYGVYASRCVFISVIPNGTVIFHSLQNIYSVRF